MVTQQRARRSLTAASLLALVMVSTLVNDVRATKLPLHLQEFEERLQRATQSNIETAIYRVVNHSRRFAKFSSLYQCHGFHRGDRIPPGSALVEHLYGNRSRSPASLMRGTRPVCSAESLAMTHAQKHAAMNNLNADDHVPDTLLEMSERVATEARAGTFVAATTDAASKARTGIIVDSAVMGFLEMISGFTASLLEEKVVDKFTYVIETIKNLFAHGELPDATPTAGLNVLKAQKFGEQFYGDIRNFQEDVTDENVKMVPTLDTSVFAGPVGEFYRWEMTKLIMDLIVLFAEGMITMGLSILPSVAMWIYRMVDIIVYMVKYQALRQDQGQHVTRCGKTAELFEAIKRFGDEDGEASKAKLIEDVKVFQENAFGISKKYLADHGDDETSRLLRFLKQVVDVVKKIADVGTFKTTVLTPGANGQSLNEYMYNQQLEANMAGMEQVKYLGCKPEAAQAGRFEFDERIFMEQLGMQSQSCMAFPHQCASIALIDELMSLKSGRGFESLERRFFGKVESAKLWGKDKYKVDLGDKKDCGGLDNCREYSERKRDADFSPVVSAQGDNVFAYFNFNVDAVSTISGTITSFHMGTFDLAEIATQSGRPDGATPEGVEAFMRCMNMGNTPTDMVRQGVLTQYALPESTPAVQLESLLLDRFVILLESWQVVPGIDSGSDVYDVSDFVPVEAIRDPSKITKVVLLLTDKDRKEEFARAEIAPVMPQHLKGVDLHKHKRLALARIALPMWSLIVHWAKQRGSISMISDITDKNIFGTEAIRLDPTMAEFIGMNTNVHRSGIRGGTTSAITRTFQENLRFDVPQESRFDSTDVLGDLSAELERGRDAFCVQLRTLRRRGLRTAAQRDLGITMACNQGTLEEIRANHRFMIESTDIDRWHALASILQGYVEYSDNVLSFLSQCKEISSLLYDGSSIQQNLKSESDADVRSAMQYCPKGFDVETLGAIIEHVREAAESKTAEPVELDGDSESDDSTDGDPEGLHEALGAMFKSFVLEGKTRDTLDLNKVNTQLISARTVMDSEASHIAALIQSALAKANACCETCRQKAGLLQSDESHLTTCNELAVCAASSGSSGSSKLRQSYQLCVEQVTSLSAKVEAQQKEIQEKRNDCARRAQALRGIAEIESIPEDFCETDSLEEVNLRVGRLQDLFRAWARDVQDCRRRCRDVVESAPMSGRSLTVPSEDDQDSDGAEQDTMVFNDICYNQASMGTCDDSLIYEVFMEHECPDALITCQHSLSQFATAMIGVFDEEKRVKKSQCEEAEASFRSVSDYREGSMCSDDEIGGSDMGEHGGYMQRLQYANSVVPGLAFDGTREAIGALVAMAYKLEAASSSWLEAYAACKRKCQDGWDAVGSDATAVLFEPFGFGGCTDEAFESMPGGSTKKPGHICTLASAATEAAGAAMETARQFQQLCRDSEAILVGEGNPLPPVLQNGVMEQCLVTDLPKLFQAKRIADRIGAINHPTGAERATGYARRGKVFLQQAMDEMEEGISVYINNLGQCRNACTAVLARALSDTSDIDGAPTDLVAPSVDTCQPFLTAQRASILGITLPTSVREAPLASCRSAVSDIERYIQRRSAAKCRARCRHLISALPLGVVDTVESTTACENDDSDAESCDAVITEIGVQVKAWEERVDTCWGHCWDVRDASGVAAVPIDICDAALTGQLYSSIVPTIYPINSMEECTSALVRIGEITANAYRSELVDCEATFSVLSPKLNKFARAVKGAALAAMAAKDRGDDVAAALSGSFRSVDMKDDGISLEDVVNAELEALKPLFHEHHLDWMGTDFEVELSDYVRHLAMCRVKNLKAYEDSALGNWAARSKKRVAVAHEAMSYINQAIEAINLAKQFRAEDIDEGLAESLKNFLDNTEDDMWDTKMKHRYLQVQAVLQQRLLDERMSDCESTESNRERCRALREMAERGRALSESISAEIQQRHHENARRMQSIERMENVLASKKYQSRRDRLAARADARRANSDSEKLSNPVSETGRPKPKVSLKKIRDLLHANERTIAREEKNVVQYEEEIAELNRRRSRIERDGMKSRLDSSQEKELIRIGTQTKATTGKLNATRKKIVELETKASRMRARLGGNE